MASANSTASNVDQTMTVQSDPALNQTEGWMLYTPGSISIQCVQGIYLRCVGESGALADPMDPSARFPKGWGMSKGDVVIASAESLVMESIEQIYSQTEGNITSNADGDIAINSGKDMALTANSEFSLDATKQISLTTPGECKVSIGSLETMLDNAITNIEGSGTSSRADDAKDGAFGALDTKGVLANLKSFKTWSGNLKSGAKSMVPDNLKGSAKPDAGGGDLPQTGRPRSNAISGEDQRPNIGEDGSPTGRPRSNAISGEDQRPNIGEDGSVIGSEAGSAAEDTAAGTDDAAKGLSDLKGGGFWFVWDCCKLSDIL